MAVGWPVSSGSPQCARGAAQTAPGLSHAVRGGERAVVPERDPLTRPPRDETRTAYILQAVESAWEGVDRRKATDARDPPAAENPNGVGEAAEAVSGPSALPQEEEVCDGTGRGSRGPPFCVPSRKRVCLGVDSF